MKTFALIALLGVASSATVKTNQDKLYDLIQLGDSNLGDGLNSYTTRYTRSAYDVTKPPYLATKWDKETPHPGFEAHHDDFEGVEHVGAYDREHPTNFQGPGSGDD